jgi:hypothetical protein
MNGLKENKLKNDFYLRIWKKIENQRNRHINSTFNVRDQSLNF